MVVFAIALQTAQDSSGVTVGLVAKDLLLSFGGGVDVGTVIGAVVMRPAASIPWAKAVAQMPIKAICTRTSCYGLRS